MMEGTWYNLSTQGAEIGGLEFRSSLGGKLRPHIKTNMSEKQECDLSGPYHIHGLALLAASGVPQLVEPVLWDYGADLDVHGKGQYSTGCSQYIPHGTCTCMTVSQSSIIL